MNEIPIHSDERIHQVVVIDGRERAFIEVLLTKLSIPRGMSITHIERALRVAIVAYEEEVANVSERRSGEDRRRLDRRCGFVRRRTMKVRGRRDTDKVGRSSEGNRRSGVGRRRRPGSRRSGDDRRRS